MSQEYSKDSVMMTSRLTGCQRLAEALWLMVAIFSIYLLIALVSFDPADPGWSQTAWHEPIHNLGGSLGAWIADVLFFTFGVVAYLIPVGALLMVMKSFKQRLQVKKTDYFMLSLRLIGGLALVVSSCVLAAINLDDVYRFSSGGLVGELLNDILVQNFNHVGTTLMLLCIWAVGFTLSTGWSWLFICERIGYAVVNGIGLFSYLWQRADRTVLQTERVHNDKFELDHSDVLLASSASVSAETAADVADHIENSSITIPTEFLKQSGNISEYQPTTPLSMVVANQESASIPAIAEQSTSSQEPMTSGIIIRQPYRATASALAAELSPITPPDYDDDVSKPEPVAETSIKRQGATVQIKPHGVPELPRANPVRIPTKRELMAHGIVLPSQRQAEERERLIRDQQVSLSQDLLLDGHGETTDQQEAVLRDAFLAQQKVRYGDTYALDEMSPAKSEVVVKHQDQLIQSAQSTVEVDDTASIDMESALVASSSAFIKKREPTVTVVEQLTESSVAEADKKMDMEGLIHPFLMRNEQLLEKPTTPLPTLDLLTSPPSTSEPVDVEALERIARLVEERLADYRVKAEVVEISPGPVVTLFELDLAPGVKAARISNLSRDLARSLSAIAVRVVEVIPGRPYVGLELPNQHRQTVYIREVLDSDQFRHSPSPLTIVLGKDISGEPMVADLAKMPHVLVAGTTGSGKSVGINAMIISMLYKAAPDDVRFIMIDPKMLELSVYEGIPHLLTEVVTDMKDAANALRWCVNEMERRYKLMSALGVRNLAGYNDKVKLAEEMGRPIPDPFWKPSESMEFTPPVLEKLPYIVVIVDEFADLMMAVGKKVEELIARLAQKARAAGIHLVLATQRPSVDVITGLIKANIPTRIAFTVSSKIDSRTILDQGGAESLLGMGDMLYLPPNSSNTIRVHGAFVRDEEVHAVVQDWKARGRPVYVDAILAASEEGESGFSLVGDEELDPLFDQAVAFVIEKRKPSISGVQRQFRIGYNRAARIIEQMEVQGIVSTPANNGNREVLAPPLHD